MPMTMHLSDYERLRKPGRVVQGISAVLLPYRAGRIDEAGFRRHLRRTLRAGLRPAVNMDTGYVDLLTPDEKRQVLVWTREVLREHDWFAAGALPSSGAAAGGATATACAKAYLEECSAIKAAGGVPVIFPSEATAALDDEGLIQFFREFAAGAGGFIAFELGTVFNPNGRMFSESVLDALMGLPQCIGLKHSSLDRATELDRLDRRDRLRPDFAIYSGNDLAADMIEYGSDYLLGLSTFAPELFAARDRAWAAGDTSYLDWRDLIQYLGWVGFRHPVPAL
jgi:dihydrodipicolinate synthase/N-acetylneuraminate lyase